MQDVLCHSLELFAFCLAVHVLGWRTFVRRNQGLWLGVIFLVLPVLMFGLSWPTLDMVAHGFDTLGPAYWVLVYIFHVALSGAYFFFYTAVSGVSPSIAILERVEDSMPHGLRRSELAPKWFGDANLSGVRRDNLLATGFISESAGVLRLRFRGRVIAVCFVIFRRFLGLPDVAKG